MQGATSHLRWQADSDGVAVLWLDSHEQKLNTLGPELVAQAHQALAALEADASVRAVVIASAKADSFVAGADIEVLARAESAADATALARAGQAAMARVEALHRVHRKPVVAAIHGAALGGGLELALACSERVVSDSPKTVLGLPEVKLGLLPAPAAPSGCRASSGWCRRST